MSKTRQRFVMVSEVYLSGSSPVIPDDFFTTQCRCGGKLFLYNCRRIESEFVRVGSRPGVERYESFRFPCPVCVVDDESLARYHKVCDEHDARTAQRVLEYHRSDPIPGADKSCKKCEGIGVVLDGIYRMSCDCVSPVIVDEPLKVDVSNE